jgi:integrase
MSNLTKSYIERIAPGTPGKQQFDWDDSIKGFGIRVTPGSKTFILDRKLNGKTIRLSIGRFPDWSVQDARERARELIVMMDKGIDPRQELRRRKDEGVTLQTVFDLFLQERPLKDRTKIDYNRYLNYHLSAWKDLPISRISGEMVMKRYKDIAASKSGPAQASSVMRFLRSVLNFAQATYGTAVFPENPVATLTAKRAWLRDSAKTDHLRLHEIQPFVKALRIYSNVTIGALVEFILLTGARRGEAAGLKWKDVDTRGRTLTFRDTKNHSDRVIPITPRVEEILEAMNKWRMGEYVFASMNKNDKPSHVVDPRKAMVFANKAAASQVTVHGIRRTFATMLESLDCPAYPLKALLGHSMRGDVTTAHYTQIGVERLRPWTEKYELAILKLVGDAESGKVVTLCNTKVVRST